MASASKGGRPSETAIRHGALLKGGFPIFIDPNRPLSHRLAKVPSPKEGTFDDKGALSKREAAEEEVVDFAVA
jgi:hypothetical protein